MDFQSSLGAVIIEVYLNRVNPLAIIVCDEMLHSEMSEEGVDSISRIAVSSASDHLKKEEVKGCEAGG